MPRVQPPADAAGSGARAGRLRVPEGGVTAAAVLERASNVRQVRPNQYEFGCSAHGSRRNRPVKMRVLDDGRVLLWPACGCATAEVLAALGLTLADLFPDGPRAHELKPTSSRIPAGDLLALVSEEISVAAILAADFLRDRSLSEAEWQRLAQAAERIAKARDHAR